MADSMDDIPEAGRLWVFPVKQELDPAAEQVVSERLSEFIEEWKSHGREVHGAFEIREGKFIIVAVDSAAAKVSGCSIDSLFRGVRSLLEELSLEISDISNIFYRQNGGVLEQTRSDFKSLVGSGAIISETPVFDPAIQSVADLRGGGFERPFCKSWHLELFPLPGVE